MGKPMCPIKGCTRKSLLPSKGVMLCGPCRLAYLQACVDLAGEKHELKEEIAALEREVERLRAERSTLNYVRSIVAAVQDESNETVAFRMIVRALAERKGGGA